MNHFIKILITLLLDNVRISVRSPWDLKGLGCVRHIGLLAVDPFFSCQWSGEALPAGAIRELKQRRLEGDDYENVT